MINAFTMSEIYPKLIDKDQKNTRCWDSSSSEARSLNVGNEVSKGTFEALKCIYQNSAGENEELWRDLYVGRGSCTGMPVSEYFDLIVKLYTSLNLNKIAYDFGIYNGTALTKTDIDRDDFLDFINAESGKNAWVECNPDEKILKTVLFCVEPYPPYSVIDCTMDRNDPTSTHGIPCDGMLKLPVNSQGGYVSDSCQPYIPYGISTKWVEPESSIDLVFNSDQASGVDEQEQQQNKDQGGGSTNIGAIVGGVVGGVVALALIAMLVFWLHTQRKKDDIVSNLPQDGPKSPAIDDKHVIMDSSYTKNGFDPYKTHINSLLKQAGNKGKMGQNEFDFHQVQLGEPIGEGSFGRVRAMVHSHIIQIIIKAPFAFYILCRFIEVYTVARMLLSKYSWSKKPYRRKAWRA